MPCFDLRPVWDNRQYSFRAMSRRGRPTLLRTTCMLLCFAYFALPSTAREGRCANMKDADKARRAARKAVDEDRLEAAESCARRVQQLLGSKTSASDWEQIGLIRKMRGNYMGAVEALQKAVNEDPRNIEARLELGNALVSVELLDEAMEQYQTCAQQDPLRPAPYLNAGNIHFHTGHRAKAETFYRRALDLEPSNFDAIVNIGVLLTTTGRGDAAVKEYRRAIALQPRNVDALSNLGSLLIDLGSVEEGLRTYEEALQVEAPRATLRYNIGNAYLANGQVPEAIVSFQQAIDLDPSLLSAKCAIASLLAMNGQYKEAKKLAGQAARAKVGKENRADGMWKQVGSCIQVALQIETCEWGADLRKRLDKMVSGFMSDIFTSFSARKDASALSEAEHESETLGRDEMEKRLRAMSLCLSPLKALYLHGFDEQAALLTAIHFSHQAQRRARALPRLMPSMVASFWAPDTRLALGYVFVGHESNQDSLMDMLFLARHSTAHDGRRVSFCYCLRVDESNPVLLEIRLLCGSRFSDLSGMSHYEAAKKINADGVHIVVDTVGHTYGSRPELFAMQPSPLQIEVKPVGSYGAHTRRSLISDRLATPVEFLPPRPPLAAQLVHAASTNTLPQDVTYSEAVVLLPPHHSLAFSNRHYHTDLHDLPTRISSNAHRTALRSRLGLPVEAFVYGYAGRLNAVDNDTLQAWVSILEQVPGSVLVLPDHPAGARVNVERRAAKAGLADVTRLQWIAGIALNNTQRSHVLAAMDVFLDTPVFTTGSAVAEGLLAATPIITLPHRKLVSRLAASMVLSAYPEPGGPPLLEDHPPTLITRTIEEYVDLAVRVGRSRAPSDDDVLPWVAYHDLRAAMLEHDGDWWLLYNKAVRMLWEAHLILHKASKDGGVEGIESALPHVITA